MERRGKRVDDLEDVHLSLVLLGENTINVSGSRMGA